MFSLVSKIKRSKIIFTKLYQADLDSPCQELSNSGLGIVITLLVRRQIDFLCVSTGDPIQLYVDGNDRPDVLAHREKWLKEEGHLEIRQYL